VAAVISAAEAGFAGLRRRCHSSWTERRWQTLRTSEAAYPAYPPCHFTFRTRIIVLSSFTHTAFAAAAIALSISAFVAGAVRGARLRLSQIQALHWRFWPQAATPAFSQSSFVEDAGQTTMATVSLVESVSHLLSVARAICRLELAQSKAPTKTGTDFADMQTLHLSGLDKKNSGIAGVSHC